MPAFSFLFDRSHCIAPLVSLEVALSIARDFHLAPLRQGIYHRHTHPVQPTCHLVSSVIKFPSGMEHGHNHFHCRFLLGRMHVHRNPSTVVLYYDAAVGVQHHLYDIAEPAHGLVDAVVHHLIHQVVQAFGAGVADVHGRPSPNGIQTFENLDGGGIIVMSHRLKLPFILF